MDAKKQDAPLIYERMALVMADVKAIAKDRQNVQQKFKFRGIDDVYDALHEIMAKHKVFNAPNVLKYERTERSTKSGSVMYGCIATVEFTFYTEDGSSVKVTTIGKGEDMADKDTNKALSGAHKYALVMTFNIPTKDALDDGDAVTPEASSASKGTGTPPKQQPEAAQPATGGADKGQPDHMKALHASFNEMDMADRDERMAYVNEVLKATGHQPVTSSKELTKPQVVIIIDKLKEDKVVIDANNKADVEPF